MSVKLKGGREGERERRRRDGGGRDGGGERERGRRKEQSKWEKREGMALR